MQEDFFMHYSNELSFTVGLLQKLHIPTHIIENPKDYINAEIDLGLRAALFGESDYAKLLVNSPSEAKDRTVYRFFDEYKCNYIFFKMPECENESFFYVGPYLPALPSTEFIREKAAKLHLTEEKQKQFAAYYRNVPIVEDENLLISIMDTLGIAVWGDSENFSMEFVSYEIPDKHHPVYLSELFEVYETSNSFLNLSIIERNYESERALMEAVSKGKLNQIDIIANSVLNQGTEPRLSDTLRNRKNYLIILNTLLRKAAEYGAVHPLHIHQLSSSFARQIEELHSIDDSLSLQKNMIRKYCLLVKEHSLQKYSHIIGRTITLISYDLTADLSLKSIAEAMNVNASYLSALFKKECGETLTDYVNRKRMENAAFFLKHTDKQIQTIAGEVGILDVNYFIKLFKRQYDMTPSQYRSSLTEHAFP